MAKKQAMGLHAWEYEAEAIAALPDGTYSVGVGQHLVAESGYSPESITAAFGQVYNELVDGGANAGVLGGVTVYVRRRGKALDVGNRQDFAELGWEPLCDVLDAGLRESGF